jgi:hypothetical protein
MEVDRTEEEIKNAITGMPKENAPGPNRLIWAFYHK